MGVLPEASEHLPHRSDHSPAVPFPFGLGLSLHGAPPSGSAFPTRRKLYGRDQLTRTGFPPWMAMPHRRWGEDD
jgi:hypothetical protein